jgi:N6-adenosine-specific RNA methylase IME4
MTIFPEINFNLVVVDAPWQPSLNANSSFKHSKARPQKFYKTMSVEEIIDIKPNFANQCHLYLWCVAQHVDWAYKVSEAWGADPVILWTWKKPGLGCGRFRCNTEHILVCRVGSRHGNPFGSGGKFIQATNGTCFEWDRGRHSEKPDEFYDLVEKLIAIPGPKLDMYARKKRENWISFGNELDNF